MRDLLVILMIGLPFLIGYSKGGTNGYSKGYDAGYNAGRKNQ